jgi:septal ring factor EnvC (AmiA/AmiB activator)
MCRNLISGLLLLVLSFSFCSPSFAQNYLMSETERMECLQLINNLEQTLTQQKDLLNSLETTNSDLLQKLTYTEARLNTLKASLENNQILLSDLQAGLDKLKTDLTECEKLSKGYEKQINWLKIERWIWAVGGIILGGVLL